jgi:hypothetical protein
MTLIDKIEWIRRRTARSDPACAGGQWLVQPPSTGSTVPVM